MILAPEANYHYYMADNFRQYFTRKVKNGRDWATNNWVRYTLMKNFVFLLFPPLAIINSFLMQNFPVIFNKPFFNTFTIFIGKTPDFDLITVLIFVIPILLAPICFFVFDPARMRVYRKQPEDFVKADKIDVFFRRAILRIFFLLSLISILLFLIFAISQLTNLAEIFIKLFIVFSFFSFGIVINVYLDLLESMVSENPNIYRYLKTNGVKTPPYPMKIAFFSIPSLAAYANSRFIVLNRFLEKDPAPQKIRKRILLFRDGLNLYNQFLKSKYNFVLSEPNKFYRYMKLGCYSKEEIQTAKKELSLLIDAIKKEDQPLKAVECLKTMIERNSSFGNICAEIDVEPNLIEKKLSEHSSALNIIAIIIAPTLFVISLILYFGGFIPNPI